jgi:capsule biosynthesis phosphatase
MKESTNTIICDLDNTITIEDSKLSYIDKMPNLDVIDKLKEYKEMGFEIIIHTARNMRTYKGQIDKINVYTLPIIMEWLDKYNVPYDGIVVGKPYCGSNGFYIDDRAIRPSEFVNLELNEILKLIAK